jgi:hypothetical protein
MPTTVWAHATQQVAKDLPLARLRQVIVTELILAGTGAFPGRDGR